MHHHCQPSRYISKIPRRETNNLEHLNKCLRETAYAASPTLSYGICLRGTYAPSRIAYARMIWVPPQSKIHHLEKKRGSPEATHHTRLSQDLPKPERICKNDMASPNMSKVLPIVLIVSYPIGLSRKFEEWLCFPCFPPHRRSLQPILLNLPSPHSRSNVMSGQVAWR